MKIAILHGSNQGFFPRFYKSLKAAIDAGENNEVRLFVPNSGQNHRCVLPNQVFFGTRLNWHIHFHLYKLTGKQDCWSHYDTWDLIKKLNAFKPDVIHLHVINQCQINIPMLVNYVNKNSIPVVWTFHDCRSFTGNCPYFDEIGCDRWKCGCKNCPDKNGQYVSKFAKTEWQWAFRKKWLTSINNLTIVTPSKWLADFVKESFFHEKRVEVIYNGVDTTSFSKQSPFDVYHEYSIDKSQKIILGCAINWEQRKGLSYFENLVELLPANYKIVLVGGVPEETKNRLSLKGILCVGRTKTFDELSAWFQSASVFVNPTLADNFPTTNIEALASGTPVITFRTGGSPEAIDAQTGYVVEQKNTVDLLEKIIEFCKQNKEEIKQHCLDKSSLFSLKQYDFYVSLYEEIADERI